MIYLLYGTVDYIIKEQIKKIQQEQHLEKINCNVYDLENDNWLNIIEDANTISLFESKKMIIVENAYIFTGATKKNNNEQNITIIEEYLNHFNPDTIMIFVVNYEKLDERKKIVKLIKKIGIVKDFNATNNLVGFVKTLFDNYNISIDSINELIFRIGNNIDLLINEIKKIKTYKDDDLNITKDDIINLTNRNINIDIFELINSIVTKNKEKAISIYNEMLKQNEEPIKIIVMLANEFRLIYQAKILYKKGYSESDIAKNLEIHPYRIKLALEKGISYDNNLLLSYIEKLADLDIGIKSGTVEKELGLELFILSI